MNIPLEPFMHRSSTRLYINCENLDRVLELRQDFIFAPHELSFFSIHLFTEGEGTLNVDFNPIQVVAKEVLVLFKNQVVEWKDPIDYNAKVIIFTEDFFCIDEMHFQFFHTSTIFKYAGTCKSINVNNHFDELVLLFNIINQELNKPYYPKQQYVLNNYLFNVLIFLECSLNQSAVEEKLTVSHEKLIVAKFKDFVNKNLNKSYSVKMYAEELNLGLRTVEYAFQKIENTTPYKWICKRIVMEISRCLLYKDLPVNAISYRLGFKEANHLSIFFKRQTGFTPLEYKNRYTKD
ncbi:helix-turn-helix transcriptional regulator [Myroides sp. 1354]|uniref:AraC family transcriptional regulator n=1 Tax=unclassified Myroides TaxID=2642485 RepID=UPI002575EBBB|nr:MULTISPECIES: AraC family transcriptional regulator [unclassified Myroides]MDM1046063.1 helix-turn-helix transcriptional regulator [Myroides sp. R163-1]MDM1056999.1 helix-turn-helix transcriptional regulator [Myroides sp. 1354]MDM1070194.1 helix-turn-helix transcriptional regulator [Myroides sp. 1372]